MPKLEISKVHDAYAQGAECPLCTLMDGAEHTYLVSFQHSRVMEPDVRVKTNASGFCPDHVGKLFRGENKLGLGLVMLTHMQGKSAELRAALDGLVEAGRSGAREQTRKIRQIIESLEALQDSCFICDLLAQDMARYSWTILYLWSKDKQFPAVFRASRGFCLSHFCAVLATAREVLRGDRLELWLQDAVPLVKRALTGLEEDLLAFTQLHRSENRSLGTDQVRSALARTLQMLSGRIQRQ